MALTKTGLNWVRTGNVNTEQLKIDGWRDIIGDITPRALGGAAPAFTAFRGGNILSYAYDVNDVVDQIVFHMPHDYVPGTDIYLHIHWGHNGTAISGTFTTTVYATYCKGFNQSGNVFGAEITTTISEAVTSLTTHPKFSHNVKEVKLSTSGGSAALLDTDKLEVDGLIIVTLKVTAIPTITGSATSNLPYIFTSDIHYQSNSGATENKAYPFFTNV